MRQWALVGVVLATMAAAPAVAAEWQRYDNPRWGFAIDLPTGFAALDNSTVDRLELAEMGGETLLSVYAGQNPVAGGIDAFADYLIESGAVGELTYRRGGRTWLVLSGYLDEAEPLIFYAKFMFSPDRSTLSAFEITYPLSDKARLDPVVARLEKTLTSPQAAD